MYIGWMMHARSRSLRLPLLALLALAALAPAPAGAAAPKPEKIPVAFGTWTGPSASTFKGALRKGLGKECRIVPPKGGARVIIHGTVTPQGKGFLVRVVIKMPKS